MGDGDDRQGLAAWDCDLTIPAPEYSRMLVHPNLGAASVALAHSNLTATIENPSLQGVFKDAGRYFVAMIAIYLHATGGLSLPRLKEMCAQSTLLSPGRARALLLYMRYLGYVKPSAAKAPGAPTLYLPTPAFQAAWTTHMRHALMATCLIEPEARAVVEALDDEDVFNCIVACQAESLFNATQTSNLDTPYFRVFLNRHAGVLIMSVILTSNRDGEFPPHSVDGLSVAATARRFEVSRAHVRRLMTHAEREGLLRIDGKTVHVTAALRDELLMTYAQQLRHLMLSVSRAARFVHAA